MLNKVFLIGRLGKDPDLSYTQAGTARCRFSLATSETYYNKQTHEKKEDTEWHNIIVWGKQAENCEKYLEKGRLVHIEDSIKTRSWDDQKSGQTRYITEIKASSVTFLGGSSEQSGGGRRRSGDDDPDYGRNEGRQGSRSTDDDDDDIPF